LISDVWGSLSSYASAVLYASTIVCLWASGLGVLTASSRQWFAYHRDGRNSWSRWLQHIDSRRQTPQRLILLLAVAQGCASAALWLWQPWAAAGQSRLIYLSAASTIAFNLSLLIPLALHYRKPAPTPERGTPYWQLGRLSRPLRLTAILWLLTTALGAATLLSPMAGGHLALILLSLLLLWPLARLLPGRWRVEAPPGRAELLAQERGYRQL
jgi:amino acid transporter